MRKLVSLTSCFQSPYQSAFEFELVPLLRYFHYPLGFPIDGSAHSVLKLHNFITS